MHVLRVIPLATLPPSVPQVLEYYWTTPLPRGAVVQAHLGRRTVRAIVLAASDLNSRKMALRGAGFQAKRIIGVLHPEPQVSEAQLRMAEWLADTYLASPGICLQTACPFLQSVSQSAMPQELHDIGLSYHISVPDASLRFLRETVRSASGPVLVLTPDGATATALAARLNEQDPLLIHHALGIRALRRAHRAVAQGDASLVIGTRSALFLPWLRLAHIIVEDPASDAYKQERSPRYFAPDAARRLAQLTGAALTLLAPSPLVTAEHLVRTSALRRTVEKPPCTVTAVHMDVSSARSLLSPQAISAMDASLDAAKPVLFFAARKGFSTAAACPRCGFSPQCRTCEIPLRYWRRGEDRMLVCYRCGSFSDVPPDCPSCHRTALRPLGFAGSQRIAEFIARRIDEPVSAIPILDADLTRTSDDGARIWKQFDAMKRPLMVASALVFGERYRRSFDTIIVPDVDALATNPDFRTTERLLSTLEKLADFRPTALVLQHRSMGRLVDAFAQRAWSQLIDSELTDRLTFKWPPFARLAILKVRHRDRPMARRIARTVAERMRRAITLTHQSHAVSVLGPSAAWIPRERRGWTEQILLVSRAPHDRFRELLSYVPPAVTVDIDPQSIA